MTLAFLGTGEFAVEALRAIVAAGHSVRVAISQPDRPAGRGRAVVPTPVRVAAEKLGIPHTQITDVNVETPGDLLRGATCAVVVAFGQKIGAALLAATPQGFINIHGSLLPRYRGAAPYQWAVINGDTVTGVTTFQLNEKWDAGPILGRRETAIGETETADELHDRLAILGGELIVETLVLLERGEAKPLVQDASQACRAPKLSKADGWVDWTLPARTIARRINGLWSWPSATAMLHPASGKPVAVQLARAGVIESESEPRAGCEAGAFRADGGVQTGRGSVRILEIKPAGSRLMSFDSFSNGRDIRPPARLESSTL